MRKFLIFSFLFLILFNPKFILHFKIMKLNKLFILGLAFTTTLFFSCSKSEDASATEVDPNVEYKFDLGKNVNRAFKGLIVDQNNAPLSGVTVKMSGKTATTNASGEFTLSNVPVKERFAYLTAVKNGYFDGSRTLMTHESLNTLKIMMVQPQITTIQSGITSTVTIGNTSVKFDGSFSTENGQVYSGAVKVLTADMPANDPNVFDKMPGSLFAIDAQGQYKGLETFGMVNVELKGSNNEKLQLSSGHTAEITMNITSQAQLAKAPARMPMWWFDDANGLWKEEGFSTKVGDKYVGNVSHFTKWNNDWAYPVASLTVIATNYDESVAQGIRCEIFRPSVIAPPDHWNIPLITLGVTGANGTLTVGVPYNELFVFRAYDVDGTLVHEEDLPASQLASRTVFVQLGVNNKP